MIAIERLLAFDVVALAEMDRLMHELSATSSCTEEKLREALEDSNSYVYVARDGVRIVGCGTLCVMHTPEFRLGAIEAVAVLKEYRGQGIGRQIVEALLSEARNLAPITLHLTSNPARQAANAMYRQMGFRRKETNCYSYDVRR